MYKPDTPHGVVTSTVPTDDIRNKQLNRVITIPAIKTGTEKLNLLNEALARARMRDLWREEHRHRRRAAGQIIRDVRRYRRVR